MGDCTHNSILQQVDKCKYVIENCNSQFLDFYQMNFCYLNNNLYLTIPICLVMWLICFFLLSDTANKYLSSALTTLAEKLKISQNLAGVTFLAFGNGAPDIISSIVASGNDNSAEGIGFSVGALVGSGIFITSIVISSVVYFAKSVKVNRNMFLRDILIYITTLILILLFCLDGKISLFETICLFVVYFIYLTIAFVQDKKGEKKGNDDIDNTIDEDLSNDTIQYNDAGEIIKIKKHLDEKDESLDTIVENQEKKEKLIDNEEEKNSNQLGNFKNKINEEHFYKKPDDTMAIFRNSVKKELKKLKLKKKKTTLEFQLDSIKYRVKKLYFNREYKDKNFFEKGLYFTIQFPFNILRDLTIPPCEKENWNQTFFIFMPLSIYVFILTSFKQWSFFILHWIISLVSLIVILTIMIVLYYITYRTKLPNQILILCFLSFSMSILWIYFIAKVLLDILNLFGEIFNIPTVFLGITLLAIGNSAPGKLFITQDLSLNCALAKTGYAEMGISGSIAGPLFNLLIGLGISILKMVLASEDKSIVFDIYDYSNFINLICVIFLLLNLIRLLIQSCILKFKLNLSVSFVGYLVYGIFFVLIAFQAFKLSN